jgi:hypothetical protein
VTAKRATYDPETRVSDAYDAVAAPMTAGTVTIDNLAPKIGATLTASPGTWVPGGVEFAYQWYRGSSAIKNAKQATYTVSATDLGKKLRVRVTGAADGYASVVAYSAFTAAVKAA